MFIFRNEKHEKLQSVLEKLEVPIKKFEAYQPIFYSKKSNRMEKSFFSRSIVEFDTSSYFTLIFFDVKLSAKVMLLKNRRWLCTMDLATIVSSLD